MLGLNDVISVANVESEVWTGDDVVEVVVVSVPTGASVVVVVVSVPAGASVVVVVVAVATSVVSEMTKLGVVTSRPITVSSKYNGGDMTKSPKRHSRATFVKGATTT